MYCLSTSPQNTLPDALFVQRSKGMRFLGFCFFLLIELLGLMVPQISLSAQSSVSDDPSLAQVAQHTASSKKILVVGDSLSAEYGLIKGQGWVALLEKQLAGERFQWSVINASISGDTTSGGLARLPALLATHRPQLVVLELGANDALRGLDLKMTQSNLQSMARLCKASQAKLLLIGMQVPPNYGHQYNEDLKAAFVLVAKQQQAAIVPFFFQGLVDHINKLPEPERQIDAWFQSDRIHPLAKAHPFLLQGVWPTLKKSLKD